MCSQVSKKEMIAGRRKKILEILFLSENGQAEYSTLVEKLNQLGYEAGDRTVRQDCKHLFDRGLAMKVKKGAAITPKGKDFLDSRNTSVDDEVKRGYLKQIAILSYAVMEMPLKYCIRVA